MKNYVIFNPETGDIVSAVNAPADQVPPKGPLPGGSGLHVRHSKALANPDKQRVMWDRLVPKTKTALNKQSMDQAMQAFMSERARRLTASDKTQMPDFPVDQALRQQWQEYRQALRDLPEHTSDPSHPDWPTEPKK